MDANTVGLGASDIRMLEFLWVVPGLWIPDKLKSAIKKACRYEPEATSTYEDCARHYGAAILPARPYHAKDKASVEMSVLVVERKILARLRNRQFFSLRELNAAIAEFLVDLNRRPFKKLRGCRAEAFQSIDRPTMKPLPATRYEYAEWIKAKLGIDYHIEEARHYYSVPHSLVGEHVTVRATDSTIECFYKGGRVAAHVRSYAKGKHTTLPEHMPSAHRKHMKWTPGRLLNWGQNIGTGTRAVRAVAAGEPRRLQRPHVTHSNVRGAVYFHAPSTDPSQSKRANTRRNRLRKNVSGLL